MKLDGDPVYYRANANRYAGIAEPGNRVVFNANPRPDRGDALIEGGVTLAAPAAPAAAPGTPNTGGGGDRQNSIVYQSSRKDALELVGLLLTSGALKLSKTPAKQVGEIELAVDRYTAQFFDDVFTLGAVTREAESEGKEPEAATTEAEDEE